MSHFLTENDRAKANSPEARARAAETRRRRIEARDVEVLRLFRRGLVPTAIANEMGISDALVKSALGKKGIKVRRGRAILPEDAWAKISKETIRRVKGKCRRCARRGGLTAHHIVPRAQGGSDQQDNLICLCAACHDWVEIHLSLEPSLKTRAGIEGSYPASGFAEPRPVMVRGQAGDGCPNDKADIWALWVAGKRRSGLAAELIAKYGCPGCEFCRPILYKSRVGRPVMEHTAKFVPEDFTQGAPDPRSPLAR